MLAMAAANESDNKNKKLSSTIYEEMIIENVRCNENLWKVTSNKFKDVQFADICCQRITSELHEMGFTEATPENIKQKWRYLRDSFFDE